MKITTYELVLKPEICIKKALSNKEDIYYEKFDYKRYETVDKARHAKLVLQDNIKEEIHILKKTVEVIKNP